MESDNWIDTTDSATDFTNAAGSAQCALVAGTSNEAKFFHGLARFYWARASGGAS